MERIDSDVTVALPTGWAVKHSITLVAPEGDANVIASSEPVPDGMTTEEYAASQRLRLEQDFPGFRQLHSESITLVDDRPAWLRVFAWEPPDQTPVTQVQMYAVLGGRGYTATATTTSEQYPRHQVELTQLIRSISVGDGRVPVGSAS